MLRVLQDDEKTEKILKSSSEKKGEFSEPNGPVGEYKAGESEDVEYEDVETEEKSESNNQSSKNKGDNTDLKSQKSVNIESDPLHKVAEKCSKEAKYYEEVTMELLKRGLEKNAYFLSYLLIRELPEWSDKSLFLLKYHHSKLKLTEDDMDFLEIV